MHEAMVIEPQVVRDETHAVLFVAVKDVNAAVVNGQGYMTWDKHERDVGWYLGLRQSFDEAVERLRKITHEAGESELQKSEIIVIRFAFTAAGFAKYAWQRQDHPPFAPLLSKRLFYRDQTFTDWGVWHFRGNKLFLHETDPVTGNVLVSSSMHEIE